MNSVVVRLFMKFLSWLNICYNKSFFGKMFNRLLTSAGKAFSSSFLYRFFSDKNDRYDVWQNSIFGKIVGLPQKFILFLQSKVAPVLSNIINDSLICSAFSKWNTVSVRIYGVTVLVFSIATTFLRENSRFTLALLIILEIIGLVLVLINRSVNQLVSGSTIFKGIINFFTEFDDTDLPVSRVKISHYIMAFIIGLLMTFICIYADALILVAIIGVILSFAFLMKYLLLGVFITVALSPILPTMVLVGLSFICAAVLLIHAITDKSFTFAKYQLNAAVVFFVISLIWGVINSFAVSSSLKQVMVHVSFVLFYFVIINVIRTKKQWLALVKTFVFTAFVVALYGVIQNFFGASSTESWIDEEMFEDIKLRVYSFFNNPNVLGEFLVLTIPISVALLWNRVKDTHRVLFGVILIFMLACMIFTWSRGAWLGMLIAIALFLVISDRRWMFAGILAVLLIPVTLYATGNSAIIERFISIGNTNDTSTAYRVSIWQASINMIKDFWIGGIGIGSDAYTTIYPSYALPGARFALHSHNLYLQYLVETGIFGIISLLAVLLGFLKTTFKTTVLKRIKSSDIAKITVALGTGFVGFMFQGLTDYVWYNYKILMIFWIVLALGVTGAKILNEDKEETLCD